MYCAHTTVGSCSWIKMPNGSIKYMYMTTKI